MTPRLVLTGALVLSPATLASAAPQCGEQLLTAYNGAHGDDFGDAVAVSGARAVVGAPNQKPGSSTIEGAAYLFEDFGAGYTPIGEISPYGSALGLFAYTSDYGSDVAVSGDVIAVGAPGTAVVAGDVRGAVFVWEHNGFTWAVSDMIVSATPGQKDFGRTVAVSGNTIVTSAWADWAPSGTVREVQVFERVGGVWTNTAVLSDPTASNSGFGSRLAIDGDRILVGAPTHGLPSTTTGSAFVYERNGGTWSLSATLDQPALSGHFAFGESVSIAGDRIAVGNQSLSGGRALIYRLQGGAWLLERTLEAPPGAAWVGGAVAVDGDRLLVGGDGVCYRAEFDEGGWTDLLEVYPEGAVPTARLGEDVALDGARALVGAPRWAEDPDSPVVQPGAAVAIELPAAGAKLVIPILADVRLSDGTLLFDEQVGVLSAQSSGAQNMTGAFVYDPAWAQLDNCYDFRWINVVVAQYVDGVKVFDDALVGFIPAIDPAPNVDPEPFYYTQAEWDSGLFGPEVISVEGLHSTFRDYPNDWPDQGVVIEFETYLVARDLTVGAFAPLSFDVLGGFSWTYHAFADESYPCAPLGKSVSSIAAALANGLVPGHVGYPGYPGWTPTAGSELFACPSLHGAPETVSVSAGGTQALELNAGWERGGLAYFILGSTSGTEPGVPLGPHVLPLVADDPYFQFTLKKPNSALLPKSLGALDVYGHASAAFHLPAGVGPGLAGLVVHHAYAALGVTGVQMTSNAVAVSLVP